MGERRRYVARNLARARAKLRADAEGMAERGMRPTWMVWVRGRRGWLRRRPGQLLVHFDPAFPERASAGTSLGPLTWTLRLLARQVRDLEAAAPPAEGGDELVHRGRRVERLVREVELELTRMESLIDG